MLSPRFVLQPSPLLRCSHRMHRLRPFVLSAILAANVFTLFSAEPDTTSPAMAIAVGHYTAREDDEAKSAFEAILAREPKNAVAEHYLGRLAKRRRDWEAASTHFEHCTNLEPSDASYWADLGEAYGKLASKASIFRQPGLARKCRAALEKAVELAPDSIEVRRGLAEFYAKAPAIAGGGHAKALAQAAEIAKRDEYAGQLAIGHIESLAKNWDKAASSYRLAAEQKPDAVEPQLALGEMCLKTGDKTGARAAFEAALHIAPGHPSATRALEQLDAK